MRFYKIRVCKTEKIIQLKLDEKLIEKSSTIAIN